jgi:thiol:disulfide interchange protein
MVMVCSLMALWAAVGGVIDSRFEALFLSFTFTPAIFLAIVLAGGTLLVLLQYWLTAITAKFTYKLHTLKAGPRIAAAILAFIAIVSATAFTWHALDVYRTHRRTAITQRAEKPNHATDPQAND